MQSMEQVATKYEVATKYNEQNALVQLHLNTNGNVCYHLHENDDQTNDLTSFIKSFLALRSICTYFNNCLTAKQIGKFCASYAQEIKDNTLKIMLDKDYQKLRFPFLILVYSKADFNIKKNLLFQKTLHNNDLSFTEILLKHSANPNKPFSRFPPLFYARTKEAAQLLIDNGADIQIKDPTHKINVLWFLINSNTNDFKNRLELFQFYINKGVDPKVLSNDNTCLFHHLIYNFQKYETHIQYAEILLSVIPEMINTVDIEKQTPLDKIIDITNWEERQIAQLHKEIKESNSWEARNQHSIHLNNYRELHNIIEFLKKYDAKTAKNLTKEKNENSFNDCIII